MNKRTIFDGYQLKLLAIGAMLLDHIAWGFVIDSFWSQVMHALGRITAPIMCYFIVEGYQHTRSFWRYLLRLFYFALIAQIPFTLYFFGEISLFPLNMIFTLCLGLLAIYSYDKVKNVYLRTLALVVIMIASSFGDWSVFAIFFCLIFFTSKGDHKKQYISFAVIIVILIYLACNGNWQLVNENYYYLGLLLSLPLLHLYNGTRGGKKYGHWLFYIFYPGHLIGLWLCKLFIT